MLWLEKLLSKASAWILSIHHCGPVGVHFVSAPVFGRPDAALEHRVLFAVAGPKEAKEKLQTYFKWMGRGTLVYKIITQHFHDTGCNFALRHKKLVNCFSLPS